MQVRKLLVFLGALKGLLEREANRRARDWLERLELTEWSEKKVIDLSKGMQQKVQLIAAIIHRPSLLILDEPFTGLDPINAVVVKDIMLELREQGATIILSTHRMEQVEMMCDSICLINHGQNILDGELQAIKKSYGKNTVRIECSGDDGFLEHVPTLIESVNHFGAVIEAKLRPGADPQEILKAAVDRGVRIMRFELMEPPLNDIFIERVSSAHA
jgi:ABC-2 type transport system ATP-binding protein